MNDTVPDLGIKHSKAVDHAIRNAKTSPGWLIPNGATLLLQKKIAVKEHGVEFIVLCVVQNTFQPYVTWRRFIGAEQLADGQSYGPLDYCFLGNYHRDLDSAIEDFNERGVPID